MRFNLDCKKNLARAMFINDLTQYWTILFLTLLQSKSRDVIFDPPLVETVHVDEAMKINLDACAMQN